MFLNITALKLLLGMLLLDNVWLVEGCLRALRRGSNFSAPPFRDTNSQPLPSGNSVQAIVTTYKFCDCVNITSWETYMQPGSTYLSSIRAYDIKFQVWRPSPTARQDDACYSLVGENVFKKITFSQGGRVQLSPSPPSNPFILAQPGDVVGYFTESRRNRNQGIQLEMHDDYSDNTVWYHDFGSGFLIHRRDGESCQLAVGAGEGKSLRSVTNAAPMIKIHTATASGCSKTQSFSSSLTKLSMEFPHQAHIASSTVSSSSVMDPSVTHMHSTPTHSSLQITPESGSKTKSNKTVLLVCATVTGCLVLVILVTSALIFVVVLLRKKHSKEKNQQLDLTNPNYESSLTMFSSSESRNRTARLFPKSSAIAQTNTDKKTEEFIYESLENESSPGCTYAEASFGNLTESSNIYDIYSTIDDRSHRGSLAQSRDSCFYHELGPDTLAYEGENNAEDNIYHVLEEKVEYDNPINLGNEDQEKWRMLLDSAGYYVPTFEERSEPKPAHEETSKVMSEYFKLRFFDEEEVYWTPASTTTAIYSQLASKKYREVPRSQIRLENCIGAGQFGEVFKATWSISQHDLKIAVKTLKPGTSEEDKVKFLQEAAIMGQFSHINVIKMHGVVTLGEPIHICLELLECGDLKGYLQTLNLKVSQYNDFRKIHLKFLKFAREIAAGMNYLSKKCFVHRDLAARNILLNQNLTCKVADFGMARDLMDDTYYTSSGGKIPIKWTAPEALLFKKYSTDSDVWSYGMVLFEIWSVGMKPFSSKTNSQTLELIQKGYCQPPPPGCPRAIYKLMVDCWNPEHELRPCFTQISHEYLKQSSSKLLYWSPQNDSLSPAVGVIGAPLDEACHLYISYQRLYTTH